MTANTRKEPLMLYSAAYLMMQFVIMMLLSTCNYCFLICRVYCELVHRATLTFEMAADESVEVTL